MQTQTITIKNASEQDFESIWKIFHAVVERGDTYSYAPETTQLEAYQIWMPPNKNTYIALLNNEIVGTYFIKPNQPELGSHVANAAYMVHPQKQGHGIGFAMANHSIEEAKKQKYMAMQFNLVVSTNVAAVKLWKKMGFSIIGVSPKAFKHAKLGFVDAYIMHRFLNN